MSNQEHPLPIHNVRIKKLKSLLAIVENSIKGGDNYLFRNLYADEDGKEIDILENGRNSCAVFVSWILYLMNSTLEFEKKPRWIKFTHATVYSTEKDLITNGWHEIKKLKPGAVVIWEKRPADEGLLGNRDMEFMHMGFCVSEAEAISNDSKGTGFPRRHHITYGTNPDGTPVRKIEKIYWHDSLND